jgi:hypothetical protein
MTYKQRVILLIQKSIKVYQQISYSKNIYYCEFKKKRLL